jgi:hypothetical protein
MLAILSAFGEELADAPFAGWARFGANHAKSCSVGAEGAAARVVTGSKVLFHGTKPNTTNGYGFEHGGPGQPADWISARMAAAALAGSAAWVTGRPTTSMEAPRAIASDGVAMRR